ncbi:hypothetical protein [Saccharopolyspora phatthalungensis]|uniref:Uncharacterized protein n=1 Tax=Saccharopolyspora phatthalungensis TaxID=664693 RepID=A0A840QAH7_9PSEU|nr:hypothetical protein [Saccharopolyspora phatthalungensis]MBB5159542.1 hypothetical protein [Saccharopolyspora phatthalungensis]
MAEQHDNHDGHVEIIFTQDRRSYYPVIQRQNCPTTLMLSTVSNKSCSAGRPGQAAFAR